MPSGAHKVRSRAPAVRPSGGAHGGKWHNLPRKLPRQRCRSYASAEGAPLKSWGPSGGNDFGGNPQEGGAVFPGVEVVCTIEGARTRTELNRSALRSNGRFIPANRGTGLNPKKCPRLCLRYFVGTPGSSERVSASPTVPVGRTELGVFVPA